ncbi:MAG: Hsp20/alpha crystallin family protein [Thermoplasmata archaeon]
MNDKKIQKFKKEPYASDPYALLPDKIFEDFRKTFWETWDKSFSPLAMRPDFKLWKMTDNIFAPVSDLVDKKDHYEADIELPGIKKEDIQINITGTSVEVSAKSSSQKEDKEGDYLLNERRSFEYSRCFELPEEIIPDKSTASFENGVLKISMPKKEPSKEEKKVTLKVQ